MKQLIRFFSCACALGVTFLDKCRILWRLTKNLRVRLKLASYHPGTVFSLNTRYGRMWFRDNFGDVTNLVSLVWPNVYKTTAIREEGVVLDVGGNIGLAAALFAFHNPGRPIYCFEPLPGNVESIRRNCPHAQVRQAAVGSKPGRVTLRADVDGVMATSIPTAWETQEQTFDVITLDDFVRENNIQRIAMLKIDTEGMELEVLAGAVKTLAITARVAMEAHGREKHDQVLGILRRAGFQIDDEQFGSATGMIFASRA